MRRTGDGFRPGLFNMSIGWDYGIAHQNIKFLNLFYIIEILYKRSSVR